MCRPSNPGSRSWGPPTAIASDVELGWSAPRAVAERTAVMIIASAAALGCGAIVVGLGMGLGLFAGLE